VRGARRFSLHGRGRSWLAPNNVFDVADNIAIPEPGGVVVVVVVAVASVGSLLARRRRGAA